MQNAQKNASKSILDWMLFTMQENDYRRYLGAVHIICTWFASTYKEMMTLLLK
jgi:hypothetical protein